MADATRVRGRRARRHLFWSLRYRGRCRNGSPLGSRSCWCCLWPSLLYSEHRHPGRIDRSRRRADVGGRAGVRGLRVAVGWRRLRRASALCSANGCLSASLRSKPFSTLRRRHLPPRRLRPRRTVWASSRSATHRSPAANTGADVVAICAAAARVRGRRRVAGRPRCCRWRAAPRCGRSCMTNVDVRFGDQARRARRRRRHVLRPAARATLLLLAMPILVYGLHLASAMRHPRPHRAGGVAAARAGDRRVQLRRLRRRPAHRRHPGRRAVLRARGRGRDRQPAAARARRRDRASSTTARPATRRRPAARPSRSTWPRRPTRRVARRAAPADPRRRDHAVRAGELHARDVRRRAVHRDPQRQHVRRDQAARREPRPRRRDRPADRPRRTAAGSPSTPRRCSRRRPPNGVTALLLIDLNHFKEINDTLGPLGRRPGAHGVARSRLDATAQPDDLVARLGGDEFAILLVGLPAPALALSRAHALLAALNPPMEVDGVRVSIEACGGVALAASHAAASGQSRNCSAAPTSPCTRPSGNGQRVVAVRAVARHGRRRRRSSLGGEICPGDRRGRVHRQLPADRRPRHRRRGRRRGAHPLGPSAARRPGARTGSSTRSSGPASSPAFTEAVLDQALTAVDARGGRPGFDLPVVGQRDAAQPARPAFPDMVERQLAARDVAGAQR